MRDVVTPAPGVPRFQPRVAPREPRIVLTWIFVATVAGLAYGLFCFWPFLVDEHRRLRPWQGLALWVGDLVAAFWFLQFFVSRALLGRPLESSPIEAHQVRRR